MALVLLVVFVVTFGGLALVFIQEGLAQRTHNQVREDRMRAIEVAERGICAAEMEILSGNDPDGDGVGTVSGSYAGGVYEIESVKDGDLHVLTAKGTHGMTTRRLEVGVRVPTSSIFEFAVFSKDKLVFESSVQTDSYDSRDGTWAKQAKKNDRAGNYAKNGGHVGSNADIEAHSSVMIRGDALAGPGHKARALGGSSTIKGDAEASPEERDVPDPPFDDFLNAYQNHNNANMIKKGDKVSYNASKLTLTVDGDSEVTLPEGTYFFKTLVFDSSSKLKVTGPVKIFVTGKVEFNSSVQANYPGVPQDLIIYAHPYPLPTGFTPKASHQVKLWSSVEIAAAIYAPARYCWLDSSLHLFGAIVGGKVYLDSSVQVHYDEALRDMNASTSTSVERLYWVDRSARPGQ